MRLKYEQASAPGKQLIVNDKTQRINTKLRDALLELMGHRCNVQSLLAWLAEDEACNQRSLVALLKACLDPRPCSGPKHTNCIILIMLWSVRTSAAEQFREEVGVMREHFDSALSKSYIFMKKNEISIDVFFDTQKDVLPLACDDAFETCMRCKSSWGDVLGDLIKVVSASSLGELIFGMGLDSMKHERAAKLVEDIMVDIKKTEKVLNKEVLLVYRQKFISGVKAQNDDPFAPFPKNGNEQISRVYLWRAGEQPHGALHPSGFGAHQDLRH